MTDNDEIKLMGLLAMQGLLDNQDKIIEKLNTTAEARQEEYDNMVAFYDGIEDEILDLQIELGMAQKQLNQMGINEYSFAGAERKLN